ncbi:MAG: nucleoside triphosphate pyrophosphatase [Pseudomonadota bacterium]
MPTLRGRLILASASPRRAQLLRQLGFEFEITPGNVDETVLAAESPADYVARLAQAKAAATYANSLVEGADLGQPRVCLGSDTSVVIDDEILGKPGGQSEGADMLLRLSDRSHKVLTAIAVVAGTKPSPGFEQVEVVTTTVWFRALDRSEATWYWHTGEPQDKAGGYGIQGIGGIFVSRIEGSYSNVVGLPLVETDKLLQAVPKDLGGEICNGRLHG